MKQSKASVPTNTRGPRFSPQRDINLRHRSHRRKILLSQRIPSLPPRRRRSPAYAPEFAHSSNTRIIKPTLIYIIFLPYIARNPPVLCTPKLKPTRRPRRIRGETSFFCCLESCCTIRARAGFGSEARRDTTRCEWHVEGRGRSVGRGEAQSGRLGFRWSGRGSGGGS